MGAENWLYLEGEYSGVYVLKTEIVTILHDNLGFTILLKTGGKIEARTDKGIVAEVFKFLTEDQDDFDPTFFSLGPNGDVRFC